MKAKLLVSLFLGTALGMSAQQGYKDGIEYFRADQPEEAQIILSKTIAEPGTDQATAYYYLGQIDMAKGDRAAAKANFDKGIAANPDNGYNYVGLGAIALAEGNLSQAQSYFKDAKGKAKKNADILTEIARAYFVADPVKYQKELDKALADHGLGEATVVAVTHGALGIGHRLGLGLQLLAADDRTGAVHIKPEPRHYHQVVPELVHIFGLAQLGEEVAHGLDYGVGTACALVTVGDGETVVYHFLYVAPILGEDKLFLPCVVCQHKL